MSADELKAMRKGAFIVMKTGAHPFITRLKLFLRWGIAFDKGAYSIPDKAAREVRYAGKWDIMNAISARYTDIQANEQGSIHSAKGSLPFRWE